MKGIMRQALAAACAVGGLAATGCMGGERYRNLVDPCYPARYTAAARQEVVSSFAPQVQNGHILDQTIWNYHFEPGTAKLTLGGLEKLDQIVRRRPEPDGRLFLATARDIVYNAETPDAYGDSRRDLDGQRVASIQKYLNAQTVGRPFAFEVLVHDPADPAIQAERARGAMLRATARANGGPLGDLSVQGGTATGTGTAPGTGMGTGTGPGGGGAGAGQPGGMGSRPGY